jgi:hypothetical protein
VDAFRFLRVTHAEAVERMGLIKGPLKGRIVRCPKCKSINAAEADGMYELTLMRCGDCRYDAWEDNYSIGDNWNDEV